MKMKCRFGLFGLAAALAVSSVSAQEEKVGTTNHSFPAPATVAQENVNVRGQATFRGEVITKLSKGERVTVLDEITLKKPVKDEPFRWYQISMPTNVNVWVFGDFVGTNQTVLPNKLNLRAGPGENYSVVGLLNKGDKIQEIRRKGEWIEIPAPTDAYAFVAADLIEIESKTASSPAPAPEVVAVSEAQPTKPAIVEPAPVVEPQPAPALVAEPAPEILTPSPAPAEQKPVRRVISREGVLRRALNIQSPTYFALESLETGKIINYILAKDSKYDLKEYIGHKVVVSGEESVDKRWPKTPVIEIETLDLP